jgi:hypothetical protein
LLVAQREKQQYRCDGQVNPEIVGKKSRKRERKPEIPPALEILAGGGHGAGRRFRDCEYHGRKSENDD